VADGLAVAVTVDFDAVVAVVYLRAEGVITFEKFALEAEAADETAGFDASVTRIVGTAIPLAVFEPSR